MQQHPGVSQGVRLHPIEAEKLSDTFVVGTQQLGVDVGRDRRAEDLREAEAAEEPDRERQYEHPLYTQLASPVEENIRDLAPDAMPLAIRADRDRPDLGEVFPQDVQRPAADDVPAGFLHGDPEFLDVLIQRDRGLAEQAAGAHVRVDQAADSRDVRGTRLPDRVSHGGSTIAGAISGRPARM